MAKLKTSALPRLYVPSLYIPLMLVPYLDLSYLGFAYLDILCPNVLRGDIAHEGPLYFLSNLTSFYDPTSSRPLACEEVPTTT